MAITKILFIALSICLLAIVNCLPAMDKSSADSCIKSLIARMDIRIPVLIEEGIDESYDNRSLLSTAENAAIISHRIFLTADTLHHLGAPLSRHSFDTQYQLAVAKVCHELGHAKRMENDIQFVNRLKACYRPLDQWVNKAAQAFKTLSKEEHHQQEAIALSAAENIYKMLYAEELYADAMIPNEKALLLAMRDWLCHKHKEEVEKPIGIMGPICSIPLPEHLKPISEINFSGSMNEEIAQAWDVFHHNNLGDYHPSYYRRAYMFNERLKAFEKQEQKVH